MILEDDAIDLVIESNLARAKAIHKTLKIGSTPSAYSFIITGLEIIFNKTFSNDVLLEAITDGGHDIGVDAVYIDDNHINIFDFKNEKKQASAKDLADFKKNLERYILKKPESYDDLNISIKNKIMEIHQKENENKKIRLFFIRTKNFSEPRYIDEIRNDFKKLHSDLEIIFYNQGSLISHITENENYVDRWSIELESPEDKFFFCPEVTFLRVRVSEILKFINTAKNSENNIFNKNIRHGLGKKTFSTNMMETLESEPDKFYIYHNGITITTPSEIKINKSIEITLENPQVVNGAQTLEALYKNSKTSDFNDGDSKILCKIVKADSNYTARICETANTQTPVAPSDLRANDDVHLILEKIINRLGNYKYLRKKGMSAERGLKGIKLTELMQWFYSAEFHKPADAKNKKKYIFSLIPEKETNVSLYREIENRLFHKNRKELKLICEIGICVKDLISKTQNKNQKSFLKHINMHLIAALYHLKSTEKSDIERITEFLLNYYKEQLDLDLSLNENKVFTKSNNAWLELKKYIEIKK